MTGAVVKAAAAAVAPRLACVWSACVLNMGVAQREKEIRFTTTQAALVHGSRDINLCMHLSTHRI